MKYAVHCPNKHLKGTIQLEGSKSISNRVLIIRALSGTDFEIKNLADAKDTISLNNLLRDNGQIMDVGPAGTTFRFLTAYLALKGNTHILTGSKRLKQRPIKPLVEGLRNLGASIEYLEKDGYPPLKIIGNDKLGTENNNISLASDISSQFITALLLIAPYLPNGLSIRLAGKVASKPYILMTLNLMKTFGVNWIWKDSVIRVEAGSYSGQSYIVESDWSAASYFYAIAALSETCKLSLDGLKEHSMQGDAKILEIGRNFGIKSYFSQHILHLEKEKESSSRLPNLFEFDFDEVPDLAQTVITFAAGLKIKGLVSGLESLHIKETDRVEALKKELAKAGVYLYRVPSKMSAKSAKTFYIFESEFELMANTEFETYDDHRMAMCLAPLGLFNRIIINDPMVVVKSFPSFWEKLRSLGFIIEEIS